MHYDRYSIWSINAGTSRAICIATMNMLQNCMFQPLIELNKVLKTHTSSSHSMWTSLWYLRIYFSHEAQDTQHSADAWLQERVSPVIYNLLLLLICSLGRRRRSPWCMP